MPAAFEITIASETAMTAFGERLAEQLVPGDTVLLRGPIGAGKTHLARAVIQALLNKPEDIPSPTYTLIQIYDFPGGEIWHADLYRLADSSELVELGLDDAMERAIVLVEWPDRLPPELIPNSALAISIKPDGEERRLSIASGSKRWEAFLAGFPDA